MDGTVTISKDEYLSLRKAELTLNLLEAGGVDNWEWYGESLNPDGEPSFEEKEEKLIESIKGM